MPTTSYRTHESALQHHSSKLPERAAKTICREQLSKAKEAGRQERLQYGQEYRQENRDRRLQYDKEYYQENRDKKLQYGKKYYQDNRDERLEYWHEHYENNHEEILYRIKRYAKDFLIA